MPKQRKSPALRSRAKQVLRRWKTLGGEQPPRLMERLTRVVSDISLHKEATPAVGPEDLLLSKRSLEILARGRELSGRRPVTLPERLDRYAEQIRKARRKDWPELVRRQVAELKSIHPVTTVARALSNLRTLIKNEDPRSPALQLLVSAPKGGIALSADDVRALRARARVTAVMNQAQRRPIHDHKQMIATARAALQSDDWAQLAAGLLLLTGRRATEILQSGRFVLCSPPRPHRLRFSGQLKTRHADGTRTGLYTIDVLAPPHEIITALRRLRKIYPTKGLSYRAVNAKHSSLRDGVRALFGLDYSSKDLRAANVRISYHAFAPPEMDPLVYFGNHLGHKLLSREQPKSKSAADADTLTSSYYLQFYIPEFEEKSRFTLSGS